MEKRPNQFLFLILILVTHLLLFSETNYSQIHSSTSAHTSYHGISMTGYQGWFRTPTDGFNKGWRHYGGNGDFKPGYASIEYWPDMREADEDEKYLTDFTFSDGKPAYVFSSVHPKTIDRHFQWMKEYGIDGAFMQRFRSDFGLKPSMNKVLENALESASKHGRAISLMYDIGANIYVNGSPNAAKRTEEVNKIFDDWKYLIDNLGLTTGGDNQPYLYHNGKPLIVLWGVGFNHRHKVNEGFDMQYWVELVDSLQHSKDYGGCSIMLGVPRSWQDGGGDCISGSEHTKFLELLKRVDIIQPWHTSRYKRSEMGDKFKARVKYDISWCNANGISYTPTISPGIREKILHGNNYEKEREGGYYFWDMAKAAIEAGSELLYLGMFDEIDEGTQYHKINNNPPYFSDDISFQTYGTDPEDHYLWLAGEATRALRGEFTMGTTFRTRANDLNFQSEINFADSGATYEMKLSSSSSGRKIYYADPYKVPDGAPTVGTVRDTALFKNELTSETVTFNEDQRGLYIRFVEVDETTDEIISFKAMVATHRYSPIPYSTGFEEGKIDQIFWTVNTDNNAGRVHVFFAYGPNNGNNHLIMDSKLNSTYSTNSADLHLDLTGVENDIILDFALKTFGNENNPEDGVFFSDDGGKNFTKVYEINSTPVYTEISLNMNELTESAGLNFSDKFVVRFQYKDSMPSSQGGMAIDDVKILYSTFESGSAQFVERDVSTGGKWMGNFGTDGYFIAAKDTNLPEYATISWIQNSRSIIWEENSSDERGLQFSPDSTIISANIIDSTYHPWWFTIDVGEEAKNVSLYFLDADNQDRQFILNVLDYSTGDKYDVQTLKNFEDGVWLSWKISGKVKFSMNLLNGPNAALSGIFFDPYSPTEIQVENSLSFDGNNDFVDCGRDESLLISGTEMTLEAWFKIHKTKEATWQSTILAMDHSESGNDIGYFMRANNGQINWGFGDGKWHEVKSEAGVKLFEDSTWNHVAGVYDGTSQKIYINGNLLVDSIVTASISPTATENLYIGSSPAFDNRVIEASLSEIRIWNIARTNSEIKEFAKKRITGNEEGLAAYWPMNEGEGQIINDMSQNNNNGILGGSKLENDYDPIWLEGTPIVKMINIMEDYNGSFENDFDNWRFFEVPNSLGSTAEIISGDVVDGASAVKITYVNPDESLLDRGFDNWDSNMKLVPGKSYQAQFWAKSETPDSGVLAVGYGFFDDNRNVVGESGNSFTLTNEYQMYEFSFTAPEGISTGWISFRLKHKSDDKHIQGIFYLDNIQLWTEDVTVGTDEVAGDLPVKYELKQNYPNPFNPTTRIAYSLPNNARVELSIYNVLGQKVADLVNQEMQAGSYEITWNAQNFASGIYIISLRTNSKLLTKKMMLLK